MSIPIRIFASIILLASSTVYANESSVWLSYSQTKFDFFSDGNSELKPDGMTIGFTHQITPEWEIALNYGESEDQGVFFPIDSNNMNMDLANQAQNDSSSAGLSIAWLQDDYSLTLSYTETNNSQKSLTRFPTNFQATSSDDQIISLSFDKSMQWKNWILGWGLGSQFIRSQTDVTNRILAQQETTLRGQFDLETLSAFADLDISYWVIHENFSWAPQISLSWSWELSSKGDQTVAAIRNDERLFNNRLGDQLFDSFRTPDSGYWTAGFAFDWQNKWSATLSFGKSIAAEINDQTLAFDIRYFF